MKIVKRFIAPYGVHVGIQAAPFMKIIPFKRVTLPFCKRMHDLRIFACSRGIKTHRALYAVEVVVKAHIGINEQRRRNAL